MPYYFSVARTEAYAFDMRVEFQNKETKFELDRNEFNRVVGYCNRSGKAVEFIPALLFCVRTNNFFNFSKDFFLPTVVNHALKVKNVVAKVFAILGALFLDLPTFPVRLVTALPRIAMNAVKREYPIRRYLREKLKTNMGNSDSVRVTLFQKDIGWERKRIYLHDFPGLFHSEPMESGGGWSFTA